MFGASIAEGGPGKTDTCGNTAVSTSQRDTWYCHDAVQADPWYQRLRIEWDLLMHLRLEFSRSLFLLSGA